MQKNTAKDADEQRREAHLVETDWLATQLESGSDSLRIVDMRGYVRTQTGEDGSQTATYAGAPEEYATSHLPGAIYLDWTRDIVDEEDPVPAQVASAEKLSRVLGNAGIGDQSLIVAYDSHPASQFATRLWWVLRYLGHDNVRVLNGGWKQWIQEGRPITDVVPKFPATAFTPHLQPEWRMTAEDVVQNLQNSSIYLVDARDEGQFTGKIRRGKRAGHIPGARHLLREALFTGQGQFRSPGELRDLVGSCGLHPESQVVAYCNGGVAATSVLFALSMLGYPRLTNYDGSWNEWSEREDLPIEQP